MQSNLNTLFQPKSVAVVGVSENIKKLGTVIFNNIIKAGFEGDLFPVNPKYDEVLGQKCYKKLSDIQQDIDVIVIVIPSKYIKNVVIDATQANVSNLIIISAGFGETGKEGKQLEDEIGKIAADASIRIVGPNCLGVISNVGKLNASFASHNPLPGNIALLSQSGALNTAILDMSLARNLGFSHFVSFGNKVDLDELDLLDYWLKDDSVSVVGMYLEEFTSGREFINIVQNNKSKPIVMLYAGTSEKGKEAASSHTGSMTSEFNVIKASMDKLGVILVDSIEKFFNAIMMFSWIDDHPVGKRTKIITNAGGPGILTTDMLSKTDASIEDLTETSKKALKEILPEAASVNNPIDILGDANSERYKDVIKIVSEDENTDILLVLLTPQHVTEIEETARILIKAVEEFSKPIIPVFIGDFDIHKGLDLMWKNKIPSFEYIEEAVAAVKELFRYEFIIPSKTDKELIIQEKQKGKYKTEIEKYIQSKSVSLPADLSAKLAIEVDLDLPKESVTTTLEEALEFMQQIDSPVVIKATTEDIAHKIDKNFIYLNINNPEELTTKYDELKKNLQETTSKETPNILIQEMISGKEELIIGVKRDGFSNIYEIETSGFGHMLLFGKGGSYTEVYKDIATCLIPLSDRKIECLIDSTKVSKIINGVRGQKPLAHQSIFKALKSIQKLILMYPEISEIDINPVLVDENRAVAVDIKIFVKK